jgi:hypothetical protein
MADGTFPADAMREEPAGDGTTTVQGVIGGQVRDESYGVWC